LTEPEERATAHTPTLTLKKIAPGTVEEQVSHRTDLNALSQRGKCADSNSPCDLDSRWVA
jgi:hypothetical protein